VKVLVCGSREGVTWEPVVRRLKELPRGVEIIHGGARGADSYAAEVCKRFTGFKETVFPANWEAHGRMAGYMRNLEMLDQEPDLVIAFWNGTSKGTKHTIDAARQRGIPVEVIS
jgi:hypothetical protein